MDSQIEFINDAILAKTAHKLTYANECILNIWHKNKVYLPLILNVGDWRMEKGMKSGCQVSFHHRSLTLQCRHFDFRTDKSHLTLLQKQRQNKIQNTKTAYFTSTKAIEWSSCARLLHYITYRVNMHVSVDKDATQKKIKAQAVRSMFVSLDAKNILQHSNY